MRLSRDDGEDMAQASLLGRRHDAGQEGEVPHHLVTQCRRPQVDRHQHAHAAAPNAVLDVPQSDREMQRRDEHIIQRFGAETQQGLRLTCAQPNLVDPVTGRVHPAVRGDAGWNGKEVGQFLRKDPKPPDARANIP
jgi:hypothetical protein